MNRCICCELAFEDNGRPITLQDGICRYCQAELLNARMPRDLGGLFAFIKVLLCGGAESSRQFKGKLPPAHVAMKLRGLLRAA